MTGIGLISLLFLLGCAGAARRTDPRPVQASSSGQLWVAQCQFPVSGDIHANGEWIRRQMRQAHAQHAQVVQFPEAALSGYPSVDFSSFEGFNWDLLSTETESILALARELKVWVLLGSSHRLSAPHKPHNCLYLINPDGAIVDRYDKRYLFTAEAQHYAPGDHFVTFEINGVRCGLLICYEARFPELYREYVKLRVRVVFQSFYQARIQPGHIHAQIIPPTCQALAGFNNLYLVVSNASAPPSWPCLFITPDGLVAAKLPANEPGVMVNLIDTHQSYYDATHDTRPRALQGHLSSGPTPDDPRSRNRQAY